MATSEEGHSKFPFITLIVHRLKPRLIFKIRDYRLIKMVDYEPVTSESNPPLGP